MSYRIRTDIAGAGGSAEAPRFDTIEARPVSAALGAEIRGADLSQSLSDSQFAEIQSALAHFGVIFFRGQSLTPERHIAFAERWGPINVNRFFRPPRSGRSIPSTDTAGPKSGRMGRNRSAGVASKAN